jgi:hypothetical protein
MFAGRLLQAAATRAGEMGNRMQFFENRTAIPQ